MQIKNAIGSIFFLLIFSAAPLNLFAQNETTSNMTNKKMALLSTYLRTEGYPAKATEALIVKRIYDYSMETRRMRFVAAPTIPKECKGLDDISNVLAKDVTKQIWQKTWFKLTPNSKVLSKLAKQLGVDAVLLFYMRDRQELDLYFIDLASGYLFDAASETLYVHHEDSGQILRPNGVRSVSERILTKLLDQYESGIRGH